MKRNSYFIDTSALIALNDTKDQYHQHARKIAEEIQNSSLIISEAALSETYTLLRYRVGFHRANYVLDRMITESFSIIDVTMPLRKKTQAILRQYNDHKISYCDALTVAMMQDEGIPKIFTFDKDFEIMGVEIVH